MKIHSLKILDYPPIKNLHLENLGDVVIIAGANGSGKTRLKQAIVQTFGGSPLIDLKIKATREDKINSFQREFIEIFRDRPNQIFNNYINSRRFKEGKYLGSFVQIDSQRNIERIRYSSVAAQVPDPDDEHTLTNFYHQNLSARSQDFMDYIHQKVAAYDRKISQVAKVGWFKLFCATQQKPNTKSEKISCQKKSH